MTKDKPVGWRQESARHALARKGIKTKQSFLKKHKYKKYFKPLIMGGATGAGIVAGLSANAITHTMPLQFVGIGGMGGYLAGRKLTQKIYGETAKEIEGEQMRREILKELKTKIEQINEEHFGVQIFKLKKEKIKRIEKQLKDQFDYYNGMKKFIDQQSPESFMELKNVQNPTKTLEKLYGKKKPKSVEKYKSTSPLSKLLDDQVVTSFDNKKGFATKKS